MTVTSSLRSRHRRADQEDFGGHEPLIVCDNLVRIFKTDEIEVVALQGLDLQVSEGEVVAIVGASGSGKSTLLNILSGLDVPSAGLARVAGQDLLAMTASQRLAYRRGTVGFVFQQAAQNLLPYLTAAENVALPMLLAGVPRRDRRARVGDLLDLVGVGHTADRRPSGMSGGEQQRAALAVALANRPRLLLADEPTGELDSENRATVFGALRDANTELGVTVVVVTHDSTVSSQVGRTVAIRDGRTATEVHHRVEVDEHGRERVVTEEYAVLDRVGRLQLPVEYTSALGMRDLVRLDLRPEHIQVWPAGDPGPGTTGPVTERAAEPHGSAGRPRPAARPSRPHLRWRGKR